MGIYLGVVGYSNSGKTTLLKNIISILAQENIKIGVIKHTFHKIDLGDNDTAKLFEAGAEVVIASTQNMILNISKQSKEKTVFELLDEIIDFYDVVFIEGYKKESIPKILVLTKNHNKGYDLIYDDNVLAVVVDDYSVIYDLKNVFKDVFLESKNDEVKGLSVKGKIIPVFLNSNLKDIIILIKAKLNYDKQIGGI